MSYIIVCLFGPHSTQLPMLVDNLSLQEIDSKFGFHESSVDEFPIEDGVRSFTDESGNEVLVADAADVARLIKRVSNEIKSYEELLDDVGEEESDEFNTFTRKCKSLRNIIRILSQ